MTARVTHVAINADDPDRARRFYGAVFGWTFVAWGPPGFFRVDTDTTDPGHPRTVLQQRRDLVSGSPTIGFEVTIAVDDLEATLDAARKAGAEVLMNPTRIDGVGTLAWLRDTEGNAVGAIQYDA